MKMIPTYIDRYNPKTFNKSWAEFETYRLLKKTHKLGFALHSLNNDKHLHKRWSEIDFVLLTDFGLMLLEVKGGDIKRNHGRWSRKPRGKSAWEHMSESPFTQVNDAMFSLERFLKTKFKDIKFNIGAGVVFSDIPALDETPETPRAMHASIDDCKTVKTFDKFINRLEEYWLSKRKGYRGKNNCVLSEDDRERIKDALRPDFELCAPMGKRLSLMDEEVKRFTGEQLDTLDAIDADNDRVILRGGAGTGKTVLAVEVAKREASEGSKVLFLARNQQLITQLKAANDHPLVDFLVFNDEFMKTVEDQEWDALVVDEGQDLLSIEHLSVLSSALKGGIDEGRWRWFMDDFYQCGFYGDTDAEAIKLLGSNGVFLQRLVHNCRNTAPIIEFVQLVTGADIGKAKLHGDGVIPDWDFFADNKQQSHLIIKQVNSWIHEGILPSDIVVISIDREETMNDFNFLPKGVRCFSVVDFKGLESRCVAVAGIADDFSIENLSSDLYTALTRGMFRLWAAIPEYLRKEYDQQMIKNRKRISGQS